MAPLTGVLTPGQIKTYAEIAGFKGDDLNTATAIAIAESSGNPKAKNFVPCYGLWQINMREPMGAQRRAKYHLASNDDLFDPVKNATAAYGVYQDAGNSFKPWTTYTSGAYKKWLPDAQKASSSGDLAKGLGKVQQTQNDQLAKLAPWVMIGNAIRGLTEGFRKAVVTYLVIIVVIVLFIMGIILINEKSAAKAAGVAAKLL